MGSSRPTPVCLVEYHGPHDVPRLFALHEPGRLWYFDLCQPHLTPGDHWSAPQLFHGNAQTREGVYAQTIAGGEMFIRATGYRPLEFRAEFCAQLAWSLSHSAVGACMLAELSRPRFLNEDGSTEPSPYWPPGIPEQFESKELADQLYGKTEEIDHGAYEVNDERVLFHLKTIADVRALMMFFRHDTSNLNIMPLGNAETRIEFELNEDRWYLTYDSNGLQDVIERFCSAQNVELIVHDEPLAEHRPDTDKRLRKRHQP